MSGLGLRIGWLFGAGLLVAAAHFSVWPARSYRTWWVALIGTELGHAWFWLAMIWAGWAARGALSGTQDGSGRWLAWAACGLAVLAAVFFVRPVWSAWRLSGGVERDLVMNFGPGAATAAGEKSLWAWARLARWPTAVERGAFTTYDADGRALDFYPARGEAAGVAAPCVVLVHGGGWDGGDRKELAGFNHWLAARGVAVAAFDYRLAPEFPWPAQREDTVVVINWIRANAVRLGIDPGRLTLVGRSAGAQIAASTAYGETPLPGVRAVVALYGVHDLEFVWSIRSATDSLNSDKLIRQYMGGPPDGARLTSYLSGSAERLARPGLPPTLIVHGALDQLVWCRHSERLTSALERAGVPHVFVRLPWGTHAGEANLHGPSGQLISGAVWRVARSR